VAELKIDGVTYRSDPNMPESSGPVMLDAHRFKPLRIELHRDTHVPRRDVHIMVNGNDIEELTLRLRVAGLL
jgi:hypothetical protein